MRKKRILFVVPHEDDEINLAGDLLNRFSEEGYDVFVVYTTNGDYEFKAETRVSEALRALATLGVSSENVFFLGYGDMLNYSCNPHIFSAHNPTVSPAGYTRTYGTKYKADYRYQCAKTHHLYTRENYLRDLKNAILQIKAEIIFVVDYDEHADHRMVSLAFDSVMGEILKKDCNYKPDIYKGFAYSTAFKAPKDFYSINVLETRIDGTQNDLIGTSLYQWKERIRFPVGLKARGHFLFNNIIFRSLCKHVSQSAGLKAESIINSDKVFWQRRSDSLSYCASIHVSSNREISYRLNDFMIYNTKDIDSKIPDLSEYCWYPESDDKSKSITFTWDEKKEVRYIKIFTNINNDSKIKKLKISFDDGFTFLVTDFPDNGAPVDIILEESHQIKKCTITILEWIGVMYGIAECEFYKEIHTTSYISPFIKITIDDNFVYNYLLENKDRNIKYTIYRFGVDKNAGVKLRIIKGNGNIDIDNSHITIHSNILIVRAEIIEHPEIFDEIILRKRSRIYINTLSILQRIEKYALKFILRLGRKYIYLRKKYINDI